MPQIIFLPLNSILGKFTVILKIKEKNLLLLKLNFPYCTFVRRKQKIPV